MADEGTIKLSKVKGMYIRRGGGKKEELEKLLFG